jgi:4-hydroxybenzoate polyprenyltransferase
LGRGSFARLDVLAVLAVANLCLVGHVFVLNDWSGVRADLADPNKAATVFAARGLRSADVGALALVLLLSGLSLLGLLGAAPLALGLVIAALSALYSLPLTHWKGHAFLSSFAHLAGGACHFLLGASLSGAAEPRAVALASYFGLTFAAGHLTQEVRDYRGDLANGIRTHAVRFGPRGVFSLALCLFAAAYAVLAALAWWGVVPPALGAVLLLAPLHGLLSAKAYRAGLTHVAVRRLQTRYRLLYVAIGLAMFIAFLR